MSGLSESATLTATSALALDRVRFDTRRRCGVCITPRLARSGRQNSPGDPEKFACAQESVSDAFSTRFVLSSPRGKYFAFFFSEIVIISRHPASLRGTLRAIVTTRGAGMRWTFGLRETNARPADVKSCGPDTPTLVSSCSGADPGGDGGQQARCTEENTYKR